MVDWKALPKIDAHIHLLPEDVIRANLGCGDPFVDYGSPDGYWAIMEKYNIESAVVMPFNDPYMLSMDFTIESVHENLRKIAGSAPSKIKCFADVDIRNSISQTLNEFDRIFRTGTFLGIKLHPTNAGYPIDGWYYDQIFQYASANGILVEIHSYPRKQLPDDICSPLRIRNVIAKYPQLRVSIAHLGGFQFEALYGLGVYLNISAVLPDLVEEYGIARANRVLRSFGADKLVFATDYPDSRCLKPEEIYDRYFQILSQMDFTLEEAKCICKYNAEKMYSAM